MFTRGCMQGWAESCSAAQTVMNQNYATSMDSRQQSGGPVDFWHAYLNSYDVSHDAPQAGYYVCEIISTCTSFDSLPSRWAGQLAGFVEGATAYPGYLAQAPHTPSALSGSFWIFGGPQIQ